jgi:hypothetical protein
MAGNRRSRWVWVVAAAVGLALLVGGFVVLNRGDEGDGHVVSVERTGKGRSVCAVGTTRGQHIRRCGYVDKGDARYTMKVGDCAVVGLLEEHWMARC